MLQFISIEVEYTMADVCSFEYEFILEFATRKQVKVQEKFGWLFVSNLVILILPSVFTQRLMIFSGQNS